MAIVSPRSPEAAVPDGWYEVVDGQIVEKPPMGAFEVWITGLLVQVLGTYARSNQLGHVVPEMLFLIDAPRKLKRRPDVAFVSRERWPMSRRVPRTETWDVVPDLAVEVISPSNTADEVAGKLEEYFRSGVRLVWHVYPGQGKVYVYDSPLSVRILQVGDDLDCGAVLPGFRMPVSELFPGDDDASPGT
jgi:Uma2 family endonuclease